MVPKIWQDYDRALRQVNRAWEVEWVNHVATHEHDDHTIRRQRLITARLVRPEAYFPDEPTLYLTTKEDFLTRTVI